MAADNISKFYNAFSAEYDNFASEQEFRDWLGKADASKMNNLYKAFNSVYDNFSNAEDMNAYLGWGKAKVEEKPVETISRSGRGMSVLDGSPFTPQGFSTKFQPKATPSRGDVVPAATTAPKQVETPQVPPQDTPQFEMPNPDIMWGGDTLKDFEQFQPDLSGLSEDEKFIREYENRQARAQANRPSSVGIGSGAGNFNNIGSKDDEWLSQNAEAYRDAKGRIANPLRGKTLEEVLTLKGENEENEAFVEEYERIKKEYDDMHIEDMQRAGKLAYLPDKMLKSADEKKAWLKENQGRYAEAKQATTLISDALEHTPEWHVMVVANDELEATAKASALAIGAPGIGEVSDFDPESMLLEGNQLAEQANWNSVVRLCQLTDKTLKMGSKVDAKAGGVNEQLRQFVEGAVNNVDIDTITFGLASAGAFMDARRIGDKSNRIVDEAIKSTGYEGDVNELEKSINAMGEELAPMDAELQTLAKGLEDMEATYKDMERRGASEAELREYYKEYEKKFAEYKEKYDKYAPLAEKYNEALGAFKDIRSAIDNALETGLSDSEKAVLEALDRYTYVTGIRAANISNAANAGQAAEQSAEFMLDFILTGGLGKAGTKSATKLTAKWAARRAGKGGMKNIAANIPEAMNKLVAKGISPSIGATMLTDMGVAAKRTIVMFPRNLRAYGESLVEFNPDPKIGMKDGLGRYNFNRSYLNAALNTAITQYIEYWSEGFGEYFGAAEKALFKASTLGAPATAIGRTLSQYRGSIGKYLDYGKFNGMFNEMLEEVVGSLFNATAGWMSGDRVGDKEAMSNFFAGDNLSVLFFSFLPMSAISAGTNIAAYSKMKDRYDASVETLSSFLEGGSISQADLDALTADITGSTPVHIKDRIVAISEKAREANGGKLPSDFTQSLLGYVEGSLCMQMEGERWADSAEKAQVASSYATTYFNPAYNPWDADKAEQDARKVAEEAGFTEEELNQDPYRMAQNALAMQAAEPERAEALNAYANAKATRQGLEDGYREETMAQTSEEDDYIRGTLDNNGQVIMATLNGQPVFVTAKDATITPDGRITVNGKDGVVTIQRGDKSQGTVKASQLEDASAVNTDVFAIITVNGLANAREAAYQRAASTISVNGMRQAVTDMVGQTVYLSDGQGVYEPIQIVRSTENGKVVVKGSKNALDAIIVAAQVNIPRGSMVEVDAARIYPLLAQNEDGTLATEAPAEEAKAPAVQVPEAEAPVEEAPVAAQAPVEAAPVEGPSMSDLQGTERTIYINGNAYKVEVTRANERSGQVEVMYKDEEGNDVPAPDGMPNVFDYSFFVQALSEPVASAPAEAEAPAPEAPVAEVPAAPASTTFDGKSTNQWVRENTPLLFDEEMSDADRAAFVGALEAEQEALRAKKAELEDKRENDKPQVTTDLQKNIEARKALRAKYTAQIEALDAEIAERERRLEGIRGVLGEINSRYAPFVPVAAKEQFSAEELAPQTPEEAVAEYIAKNFKSGGQTIDIDDFRRETGYKGEASDFFFLKKGGMTIRQLAERIAAEYPGLFGGAANEADAYASGNEADDSRARNAIIDLFGQVRNKTDINNYVLGHRREQAQADAERQNADLRHAMEESVGMPLEQYESQRQRMIQEDINAVLVSLPEGSDVAAAMRNYYTEKFGETQPEAPAEEAPAEVPVAEAPVEGPAADVEDLPFSKSETVSIEENPNTEAKKARIAEWADRLGLPITIYESLDDVQDPTARREIVFADMARARGGRAIVEAWYNPTTHKVEIYLPHLAEGRIDAVILHEVVAHRGLRELLKTVGEDGKVSYEKFDALMDYVWNDLMSARDRARWLAYNSHIQGDAEALRRAAADELVAHFSETLDPDVHPSKWRRFVAKVKQFLKSIGIDIKLKAADIDTLLRNSLLNYERNRAAATEEAKGEERDGPRFSRVYHGSGADFDRFDHSHMGEGSGSQSYGWGTYVTTNHDTGTTYANSTSGKRVNYAGEKAPTSYADELVSGIAQDMQDHDKSFEDAKRENLDMLKRVEEKRKAGELGEYWKNVSNEKEIEFLEGLKESDFNVRGDGGRHLYIVDIPDDNGENYLHWDGYLTRGQSNKIMDAVRDILKQRGEYQNETEYELKSALGFGTIGRHVEAGMDYFLGDMKNYSTGENPGAERNAKILNSIGIVGMEIPIDRNGGQRYPGSNYVIFDENNLKIADHLRFSRTPEQKAEDEKVFAAAKDYFGTTRNIREAGYILPDGTMLDFSGRHLLGEGADSSFLEGRRTTDHREIESLNYEKDGNTPSSLNVSMPDFIRSGAIRIDSNAGAINLATLPTDAQQAVLRRLIEANGGDVWVDFGDGYNSEHYAEYEGARPARVLNEITRFFNEGYRPENIQFSKQDFESAQADQKQPNGNYPSSAELESDAILFSLTRNNRATIASWLNKRVDLNEEQKASVMAYLEELENPTLQLATAKWFTQGSVRLPEDMSKVEQAVAVARKAKVDPLQYASPMELIDRHADITLSEKPIDPDTVSTLHRAKDIPEHGLVVYDVDDTQESRENMRNIINTHFGKEASPWCLLQGDGEGHLTESSARYWKHYNGYPKQVVFRNGKLLAFSANDSEERLWWDRQDSPHRNMPAGRLPLKGDKLGRSADYIYTEDGKLWPEQGTHYYKGNTQNGDYAEWLPDGKLSETGHYTNGKEDGEFVSYWDNGKVMSLRHYKNGLADGLHEYYYTDGSVRSRSYFKDDKFDGVQSSFYENGNLWMERSIREGAFDGPSTEYYENGLTKEYIEYKNGKKDGVHRRWNSNGVLMVEEHLKNDNLEGESRRWFGGGAISRIENYKNNRLDGIQELYEFEGWNKSYLAQRNVYENDIKISSEEFFRDGSLHFKKNWDNEGRPYGVWKFWGPSGELTRMEAYNHSFLDERNLLAEGVTEEQADNIQFSKVTDPAEIERLENEDYVTVYRAMELVDGQLYPPMSQKEPNAPEDRGKRLKKRQPSAFNEWERSDEQPDRAYEKDGKWYFDLKKNAGSDVNGVLYNPYFHTSTSPLNDQFSSASTRPNLVVVESRIPKSELTSGYKAEKANDTVGPKDWHSGSVTAQIGEGREVILSRWVKPMRIVPDSEVADIIAPKLLERNISVPYNVITPGLRAELEKKGVGIIDPIDENSLRFSKVAQMDADYLAAVEAGDMETASRMVASAARRAFPESAVVDEFYVPKVVLHGTRRDFNAFDPEQIGSANDAGWLGRGFYFYGNNPTYASQYANFNNPKRGRVIEAYLNITNPYWASVEEFQRLAEANSREASEAFTQQLKEDGYDGVYYNGDLNEEWVAFYPNQIKSAEPVVYDNEGQVIPLSERFNSGNDDIRFSKVEDNEKMYSDFKKKYTPLAPMVSMKVYNNADELGNYTDGNIAIFVNKNESPEETENTCFHENVHAYTDVAGISQEDYAKVVAFFMEGFKGETLEYWTETRKWVEGKKNYEGIVEEEMAARLLADLMSSSHAARILRVVSRLAPEVHAIISDYFNRLGYDAEQESAERAAAERAISVSGRDSGDVLEGGEEGARGTETRYSKVTDVPDGLAGDIVLSRAIDELADSFKGAVKVNKVSRDQMPKGHKTDKGYYDTRSGEVYICIDNIESVDDAIATVMHEAVAHLGLRQLFGDRFPEAMNAIYQAMSPEIRHEVHASMTRNGWDAITATEEYLARLAEKEEFTPKEKTFWDRVKEIFEAILSAITGKANVSLTDNELRYILQASYMNLTATPAERQGVQYAAREILLKDKYKVNDYVEPEYLARTPVFANGTDSIKNYEESVEKSWQKAQMEFQDAQQPVRIGIAAIQAETGNKPITEDEDYLTKENLASSIAQTQQVEYLMSQIAPIVEQVGHIIEKISGKKNPSREERAKIYNDIISYLYAKHGAERNRYANALLEKQEAEADKAKYDEKGRHLTEKEREKYAAKDWSGLTSLFGLDKAEHEAAEVLADELCEKFEAEVGKDDIDLLWDRIQAATDYNLKHALDSGLLSKDEYDRLHGNKEKGIARMWEHYVPLRGFTEKTAEEEYNYANLTRQQANSVVTKKYKGRTSLASDPIANIVNIGETEIRQGNANLAKIALYRYVMNRPENKLLTATDMWFVKQDDGTWVREEPRAKYDANGNQTGTESFEDFEARMEALKAEGKARKGRRNLQLDKIMTNAGHQNEHLVRLKVNGQEKGIWVNGNPQLARAVAGSLRKESMEGLRNLTRSLSNLFTTYSLKFALRNFWRDTLYSQMRLLAMSEENGREYWVKYEGNWFKNFGAFTNAPMIRMVSQWNKGTLQKKENPTETEKMFMDFMRDGGPTGYTVTRSVEQVIKDIHKDLNMFRPDGSWLKVMWENASSSQFAKVLGIYPRAVQALNESFELLTRFTAYQTSRQMGRSGQQAASDAKEISVNFNRKGAQTGKGFLGAVAAYFGATHYFFNAGVQGFQNFMSLYQKHPYKMTAFSTMLAMMGFLTPYINALLAAFGGGDDDDDQTMWYWNLPIWTRRSSIIIGTEKAYVAIALGPEQRALYGLGDILAAYIDGRYANKSALNIAGDVVSQLAGLLPINPVEDLKGSKNVLDAALRTFVPDPLMAAYDMATNRDYTGKPLQKENPFSKTSPNCYGAYSSTPDGIVKACQWIAEETAKAGHMIDLPPGYIREVFRQYGGGVYTAFEEAAKFTAGILNEDKPLRTSDFPLTSGVIGSLDDDRKDSFAKNALNEYKSMEQALTKTMKVLLHDPDITEKGLFEGGLPDDAPKYASKLFESDDYELAKMYYEGENGKYLHAANGKRLRKQADGLKDYRKRWNDLKDEYAKMPKGTEEEQKAREDQREKIQKAWDELVTAENKLVDELLQFEYKHPSVSKKIEDAIKK